MSKKWDAIVVGAGPAGCLSAKTLVENGLKVCIIERHEFPRHKPCAGLLPEAALHILNELADLKIPDDVKSCPEELGLFYVPPSGLKNGGRVPNYKLLNVDRKLFDHWLLKEAENAGCTVYTKTEFRSFKVEHNTVKVVSNRTNLEADFLIGADGVLSRVRRQINRENVYANITQWWFKAENTELEDFYIFLNSEVSPLYAYIVPKKTSVLLGVGSYHPYINASKLMPKFIKLVKKTPLKIQNILRSPKLKETWFIPFGFTCVGEERILLVGDASGVGNGFSGEGIRLAVESGFWAATAIIENFENPQEALHSYRGDMEQIIEFSKSTVKFAKDMNDEKREEFVKVSLKKGKN
ncbi:MAG: NAD(P)/FAD-dependent oxidoreductase [Candidatus Odinarchaeia archaeon]